MASKESARKEGKYLAVSETPDPCKTPPNDAPVPYNLVAELDQALSVSPNVKYQGFPLILADESSLPQVKGDEAGSSGGVISGTNTGEVKFVEGAGTVKTNGRRTVGHGHKVTMNKGNTKGVVLCAAPPASSKRQSDPPVKDPRKTGEITTKTFTFQATSVIQRDTVVGPAWNAPKEGIPRSNGAQNEGCVKFLL